MSLCCISQLRNSLACFWHFSNFSDLQMKNKNVLLNLLDEQSEHMGGHISLDMVLNAISIEEWVKNLNEVFRLLKVILHINEVLNSSSGVLKDTVEVCQTIPNQLVVTLHIVDDIEEPTNCCLSFFLVLIKSKTIKGVLTFGSSNKVLCWSSLAIKISESSCAVSDWIIFYSKTNEIHIFAYI